MVRKCASCQKDLHLVEDLIAGYCTECVNTEKVKGEAKDLENVELNKQIARLVKQPRFIELINRLKSLGEAVD
jgi:ribosomal protein S8